VDIETNGDRERWIARKLAMKLTCFERWIVRNVDMCGD
jgi:hypothetical protein